MKAKILLLSVCCLGIVSLQAQKMDWYSLLGSSSEGSHIRVNRMAIDSEDNAYVTADFCGNAVSVEEQTLSSKQALNLGDAVLIKTTQAKEIAWIRTFSESKQSKILDIVVDSHDNIVVAGTFNGTINPAGNNPLTFDDGEFDDCTVNAFVVRFDKNGTLLNQWRIPAYELAGLRVAVDVNDNVYVAGTYGSYIQFTGTTGEGEFGVDNQLFFAKYAPTGDLLMSKYTKASTISCNDIVIQVDTNGDIYLGGSFVGTLTFAGSTFTASTNDVFLSKYNAAGAELWAKKIGSDGSDKPADIVLSPAGDVAIAADIASTSLYVSEVDSTFRTVVNSSGVCTFTKEGTFRWIYWYGYNGGGALARVLRCTDEGIYYFGCEVTGRFGDISTPESSSNAGSWLVDGQHVSQNTNGGMDAIILILSPEGKLCNFYRPGGAQYEVPRDILLTADKKHAYLLISLSVRDAIAQIPINNFFVSFTDINAASKQSDFTTVIVPCPETVAPGGSYTGTYKGTFYSGLLMKIAFPEITPNELPAYTGGTPYSQSFSMSNPDGTVRFIPLNLPGGLSLTNGQLSGTLTGKDPYYVTVIASDSIPRYSYFNSYALDTPQTTRGNSRNIRNFILKSTEASGLKDIRNNVQKVFYPTLVSDALQVNTDAPSFVVNIYNLLGSRVLTASSQKTIAVTQLSSGIYLAEIVTANGQKITERIIVK
jgi:hypothetical protein